MQLRKRLSTSDEGFSTIEAIVSMVILSVIITASFVALSALSFFATWDKQTLQSSTFANTKMAESFSLLETNPTTPIGVITTGTDSIDGVDYEYTVTTQFSTLSPSILLLTVHLSWDSQKPRTYDLKRYYVIGGN